MGTTKREKAFSSTRDGRWIDRCCWGLISSTVMFTVTVATLSYTSVAHALNEQAIATFKRQSAQKMCADAGAWLRCFSIDPLQCETISAKLLDECVSKEALLQPGAAVDSSQAAEISESLFACARSSFLTAHGKRKVDSDECSEIDS
jgi:hypothetical protein